MGAARRNEGFPDPAEIIAARERLHLSTLDCAKLVHSARRTWQQWESGDRNMHPGLWELFQIKIGKMK
jgi:DNA (cytosine-5)-methyltransferase 1